MDKAKHRNGVPYPLFIKEKAIELRKKGRTYREIVKELGISLGSANLWAKRVKLSPEQKTAILKRRNKHIFTSQEKVILVKRLRPYQYKQQYSNEELIEKIKKFYQENQRIPLKREFNSLRIFRERFGSWNRAIRIAGFDPNPILFSKRFIAKDNHICDSFTERIIDDWFYEHRIAHDRNFKYGKTKMTADFFIQPNIIVEFFGLAGVQKDYDEILARKREFCKNRNLRLIEIYPKDIFPKNNLSKLFRFA